MSDDESAKHAPEPATQQASDTRVREPPMKAANVPAVKRVEQAKEAEEAEEAGGAEETSLDFNEEGDTGTPAKLTAKGKVRMRNAWWSKEEQQSLFLTCMKHEAELKRTGGDPDGKRKVAWQCVVGK